MKKKYIAAGAAALLLLGSLFIFVSSPGDTVRKEDTSLEELLKGGNLDIRSLDSELLADFLSYRMIAGKAYTYGFKRNIRGSFGGKEFLNLSVEGILTAHIVQTDGSKINMVVNVEIQKATGLEKPDDVADKVASTGTYTAHLSMSNRGRILDVRYPSSLAARDQVALVGDVIAKWVTVLPNANSIREGRAEQKKNRTRLDYVLERITGGKEIGPLRVQSKDTQGDYSARFFASQNGDEVKVEKNKTHYTRSAGLIKIIQSGNSHLWDNKGGYFRRIQGAEEFAYGEKALQVSSHQEYRYDFRGISAAAFSLSDLALYRVSMDLYQKNRVGMNPNAGAPVKPWKELKPMLAAVRPGDSRQAKNDVFNTLASSLKSNPALTKLVMAEIRAYPVKTEQYKMLMGAVTYSGSPRVQSGLIDIFRMKETPGDGRMAIIQAFTVMSEPFSGKTNRFLTRAFDDTRYSDMRDNIGLAMGSSLRNQDGSDAAKSETEKIREMLMDEWRKARTPERRRIVMEMLGNSGDEYFMDTLAGVYEGAGDSQMRALAVYSMRFIDTEKTGRYIISVLRTKAPLPVQSAALEALAMHTFRDFYFEPLESILRNPGPAALRMKSAEVLLNQRNPRLQARARAILDDIKGTVGPDFRRYIEQLARTDT